MYTNGTATAGYLDLLDTVIDYVTTQLGAENWVVQRRIPPIINVVSTFTDWKVLFDADANTRTNLDTTAIPYPHTLELEYSAAWTMDRFELANYNNGTQAPGTIEIEYHNGSTWVTHQSWTGLVWANGETKLFTLGASPGVRTRYRWRFDVDGGGNKLVMQRLDAWDTTEQPSYTSRAGECILRGVGTAGTDNIYIGIRPRTDADVPYHNWELRGFTGYSALSSFDTQPNASPPVYLLLEDTPLAYWLVANGRRIILVSKVATVYQGLYLGFFLPYATPSQYPYPLMIGGNMGANWPTENAGSTHEYHRTFVDPGGNSGSNNGSLLVRSPSGQWMDFVNYYESSGNEINVRQSNVWPFQDLDGDMNILWQASREAPGDGRVAFPLILHSNSPTKNTYGEIDACFAVNGFNLNAEDLLQIGGVDHLVVQNAFRSDDPYHWLLRLQ